MTFSSSSERNVDVVPCVNCGEWFTPPPQPWGASVLGNHALELCPDKCYPVWRAQQDQRDADSRTINRGTCAAEGHVPDLVRATPCMRCGDELPVEMLPAWTEAVEILHPARYVTTAYVTAKCAALGLGPKKVLDG